MQRQTVGQYLVDALERAGLKHIFGIPGDYVLSFYDLLEASRIDVVGTCTELGAGYAADAYARVHGLGAVCVTYSVGGFNALNAVAGAYAEKSPLVLISGAPGMGERTRSALLHHRVRDFDTQLHVFEKVTAAAEALNDPMTAARQIDRALHACVAKKRPVYIELPRDMVHAPCRILPPEPEAARDDPTALREAVEEAAALLRRAKRPVILAGVEIHRYGLQALLMRLVESSGYPVAATLLGKSVIAETHPQYAGIYQGAMMRDDVRRLVENSDCLLILGVLLTDIDMGAGTSRLDLARTINATADRISIHSHHFDCVSLHGFVDGLLKGALGPRRKNARPLRTPSKPVSLQKGRAITVSRFFARIDALLTDDVVVVSDVGDCLFGAAELTIHRRTEFLGPSYYASMGFGVPAGIGVQIGRKHVRALVLVGDGGFQMTGHELSTAVKYGLNPIVLVMNNQGYTTERFIHEGPYNDIHEWNYHRLPEVLQAGLGIDVRTEDELEDALDRAWKNTRSFTIVNLHFDKRDCSDALARLGRNLGKHVGGKNRVKKAKEAAPERTREEPGVLPPPAEQLDARGGCRGL